MIRTLAISGLLLLPATLFAQTPPQQPPAVDPATIYTKREVMIPMRDGVKLFTAIYVPKDTTSTHPIIMTRTPYSSGPYGEDKFPGFLRGMAGATLLSFVKDRYIFVFQDVRGRFMSEGQFVNVRPFLPTKKSSQEIDEASDTYDTVEWLLQNVRSHNGKVGVRGTSYPGFYSSMAALSGHPAIKAVSPQAPVTEWMSGDDFIHNGALLLPHAFDFYAGFGRPRPGPTPTNFYRFNHGTPDGYDFFLNKLGALKHANPKFFRDSVAYWDTLAAHPTWDAFWQARSVRPHLRNLKPAMLWVGGWFDAENLWGALNAYAAAELNKPGELNRLVMGPWSHGQWNGPRGDSLGAVAWGSPTTKFFSDSIEVPFFNHYLLNGKLPLRTYEAAVFETGTNAWHFLERWPLPNTTPRSLYLGANGALSFDKPTAQSRAYDEYVSDPKHPVPYTAEIRHWYNPGFMVEDQRFAARRPDVLTYQTAPLTAPLTLAGPLQVDFVVSTSGTDSDWIVKVIDVFPDTMPRQGGYQMLVRGDVLRGKFRNSMSTPEPFVAGQPTPIRFKLEDVYHTFLPGHRVMVQVQSTWFPMVDRNPGKFMDIYQADDADFVSTTQRVFRSAERPSRIVLPVVNQR